MEITHVKVRPRDFYDGDGEDWFLVATVQGVACKYAVYGSLDGVPSVYAVVPFPDGPPAALDHPLPGLQVEATQDERRPIALALSNAASIAAVHLAHALAMEDVLVESS